MNSFKWSGKDSAKNGIVDGRILIDPHANALANQGVVRNLKLQFHDRWNEKQFSYNFSLKGDFYEI